MDLNQRPPGYEPDELPTALPSVVLFGYYKSVFQLCQANSSIIVYILFGWLWYRGLVGGSCLLPPDAAFQKGKGDGHKAEPAVAGGEGGEKIVDAVKNDCVQEGEDVVAFVAEKPEV